MLGQIRIEFIAGILIFSIIIAFIVNQTNITFSNLLIDSRADILKSQALNSITILVEDMGKPPDWNPSNVERVGLAVKPYSLSIDKINDLSSDCSLLDNFILKAYRLKIYNSTDLLLFCGIDVLDPPAAFEVKYVEIEGDYGNVTLELW
jgi:hypothetical protein